MDRKMKGKTMLETKKNIRLVHEEAEKPDSLYTHKSLKWFVGRVVKLMFQSAESNTESMWVQVTKTSGHNLVGTLDNDPAEITHLRYGGRVVFNRTQILAVGLTREEWIEEATLLRGQGDYYNQWLGVPSDENEFVNAFTENLTPRQALKRWRDFVPGNDME